MTKKTSALSLATASISTLALAAQAQSQALTPAVQKPAWLSDLSLGIKESYDDNVFLQGVTPPPGFAVQPNSVAALRNVGSWVTMVSPKIGIDFAPLLGNQTAIQTLSFTYAPDYSIYHSAPSESNEAHRLVTAAKGGGDGFSFGLDDVLTYVHGSTYAPTYPDDFISAWAVAVPRNRREQVNDIGTVFARYDLGNWFIRPVASMIYYDLMTEHLDNVDGYLNYVGRYDLNGGSDVGYQVIPKIAVTLGYRYGYTYQEELFGNPMRSSSQYQRALAGIEGKPWSWLDVKIQGGPDFRDYVSAAPVNDDHQITYYGEAALSAKISSNDSLIFKYKGWQWVSMLGYIPYFDSSYQLTWHHKLPANFAFDLGAGLLTADYSMGNLINRYDMQYTASAGLTYAINSHASLGLGYTLNLGRSAENFVNNVPEDQYDQQLVSLSAVFKF